jgi:hypothetical protein
MPHQELGAIEGIGVIDRKWVTGLQSYRVTELQSYRVTELQSYGIAELRGHRVAGE